ncbi:hypothetical protein I4U23_000057 [Adineta vaga]|nr:hypothetical protein I4U23_000057 [Adineta vaga]
MLTFSVERQLITLTLKPNCEKDEIVAGEATLVYHGFRHGISYLAQQSIIDFIDDSSESAIDVHQSTCQILDKYELNLAGLTTIEADNTNVNMRECHSAFALFRDEKPTLLKGSCHNHILHNSIKHAHKLLPIGTEKHLLTRYAHFSRRAKRIAKLKCFYEFCGQDYLIILKYTKEKKA